MALQYEIILRAGIEGGEVILLGLAKAKGWLYSMRLSDSTPALFDRSPAIHRQTGFVDTWPAALELLKSYQWETFAPKVVHPEYRQLVYEAYVKRYLARKIDVRGTEDKWKAKCFDTSMQIHYQEQTLVDMRRAMQ